MILNKKLMIPSTFLLLTCHIGHFLLLDLRLEEDLNSLRSSYMDYFYCLRLFTLLPL